MTKSKLSVTAIRFAAAIVGGLTSSLAFPRENISPLIFVSIVLLFASVRNLKPLPSLAVGFTGGLAFYLSQIEWLSLYLGPIPWLALSILEASIFALGMFCVSVVWRWMDAHLVRESKFRNLLIAAALATLWTAREWISITIPYGGFPWSRLAQTQSETFLSKWVYLGGLGALTFAIAFISAVILQWILTYRVNEVLPDIASLSAVAVLLITPALVQPATHAQSGEITIGAVQGNANAGLFANEVPGTILNNHLEATKLLKGKKDFDNLDVVVWPENASDLSPFSSATAYQELKNLVDNQIKVPLVFGTITQRGDELFNSSILWQPNKGATDYYDKKRPVPFAEYVPDRDFWYQLAPDLIGLISRGYTFGTRDGIFEAGNAKLGTLICFEIAIDDIGRSLVADGAQIIISQTNNADFGHSDETYQQAAFARLRAIETGRVVVNVSTVGVSAIYAPDGSIIEQVPSFEPAVMLQKLPLRDSITPAVIIGPVFNFLVNLAAALLIALAFYKSAWPPARRARM
jgi:apolipoprotein N-acyltransferase